MTRSRVKKDFAAGIDDNADATAITIDSSENVGIGETDPDNRLHVKQSADNSGAGLGIKIEKNADDSALFVGYRDNTDTWQINASYTSTGSFEPISFHTSDVERMRIDSSGNVGIGGDGNAKLEVFGPLASPSLGTYNNSAAIISNIAGGYGMSFSVDGTGTGYIQAQNFTSSTAYNLSLNHAGGSVGIGTTNPSAKLHVKGDTLGSTQYDKSQLGWFHHGNGNVSYLEVFGYRTTAGSDWSTAATRIEQRIDSTSQSYIQFNGTGNSYGISFGAGSGVSNADSDDIIERMRITSIGDLLVGKSVVTGSTAGVSILGSSSTLGVSSLNVSTLNSSNSTSNHLVNFRVGGTVSSSGTASGAIAANGASQVAFVAYSDERIKENIRDLPSQLENIKSLRPCEFDYKDGSGYQIGFIAQEMQQVYSDCVGEDEEGFLTIGGWNKTEARLVKAIQEQQTIIDSQTSAIADLTARLEALEAN